MTKEISFYQAFIVRARSAQLEEEGNRYNHYDRRQLLFSSHHKIQKLHIFKVRPNGLNDYTFPSFLFYHI